MSIFTKSFAHMRPWWVPLRPGLSECARKHGYSDFAWRSKHPGKWCNMGVHSYPCFFLGLMRFYTYLEGLRIHYLWASIRTQRMMNMVLWYPKDFRIFPNVYRYFKGIDMIDMHLLKEIETGRSLHSSWKCWKILKSQVLPVNLHILSHFQVTKMTCPHHMVLRPPAELEARQVQSRMVPLELYTCVEHAACSNPWAGRYYLIVTSSYITSI